MWGQVHCYRLSRSRLGPISNKKSNVSVSSSFGERLVSDAMLNVSVSDLKVSFTSLERDEMNTHEQRREIDEIYSAYNVEQINDHVFIDTYNNIHIGMNDYDGDW